MLKTNFHTHTIFCDGKGTPEEIAQKAVEKGFNILGFSSHSMYPFAGTWHIAPNSHTDYAKEVHKAQEKLKDKITILLGFEADYIPMVSIPSFNRYKDLNPDYLIGSVHYVFSEKGRLAVDYSATQLKEKIDTLYNGNSREVVQRYFELQREMLQKGDFTIIGHCDLIRKNNEKLHMFNEKDDWYRNEIKLTADAIKKAGVIAEVNTGAIARGTMDDVYPSSDFLSLLFERNVPVTISSDCHDPDFLDCGFEKALEAIKKAGYKELAYMDSDKKIKFQKID